MKLRSALAVSIAFGSAACARPTATPVPPAEPAAEARDTVVIRPNIDPAAFPTPAIQPPPAIRAALPVRFAFTGDINLGTTTLPGGVPPDDGRQLFAAVDSLLVGDLVVGNFEGVLADSGTPTKCLERPKHCYAFLTPTTLAFRLVEAGFTHLNLANNHVQDMGPEGRAHTERTFAELGLRFYGPLGQISIDTLRHGDSLTLVGLIGFTTYPFAYNLLEIERSAEVVDSIRQLVDVVVVTFHGGAEGTTAVRTGEAMEFLGKEPRGELRRWARAVMDAGAHAVIGHGPHVLRGVEFYQGKPIFYSLGNFATYRGFNLSGPLGLTGVLQLELAGDGAFRSARLAPAMQIPRVGPVPDSSKQSLNLIRRLSKEDFGDGGARVLEDGSILPP